MMILGCDQCGLVRIGAGVEEGETAATLLIRVHELTQNCKCAIRFSGLNDGGFKWLTQ